jgi:hypothetical protein
MVVHQLHQGTGSDRSQVIVAKQAIIQSLSPQRRGVKA